MIKFNQLSYTYPGKEKPALKNISLHLQEGDFALLVGPSGAGKSTLLRCVNGLVPHFSGGLLEGDIAVDGLNPVQATPKILSRRVGFVFQDPEAQFVMDRVEDEIAFALENAAMPPQEMRIRVEEALDLLDLAPLRERRLDTLSGGERQRVAIASALAFRPKVLALDEPTSQLDPKSAEDVLHALVRLNADLGLTVLLAEHRLERVLPFIDTLIYLSGDGGQILSGDPRQVLQQIGLTPPLVSLGKALGWQPLPLTIKEGRRFSRRFQPGGDMTADRRPPTADRRPPAADRRSDVPYLQIQNIKVAYDKYEALRGIDLDVHPGEIVVLMGRNGAGKSTILKSIVGLLKPKGGNIRVANRDISKLEVAEICRDVAYLPQNPNALLFAETVQEELAITLKNHGLISESDITVHQRFPHQRGRGERLQSGSKSGGRRPAPSTKPVLSQPKDSGQALSLPNGSAACPFNKFRAGSEPAEWVGGQDLLNRLGIGDKADAYPRDLSAGERQRVALGAIMVTQPRALLLDEPTRGLDYGAKQHLIELLQGWAQEGAAILLVTHDVELAAAVAGRVVLLSQGEIIANGPPAEVLGSSPLFAPQVARLFPDTGWLTVQDVLGNEN